MPALGSGRPIPERFWPKVDRRGPDECWPWLRGRFDFGYGVFWDGKRTTQAHRVSWELAHGPVPEGQCVLHRCDNPPCVNPAHLFLGTKGDNNHDMMGKARGRFPGPTKPARGDRNGSRTVPGTRPRGEAVRTSKLTQADVLEIHRMLADGAPRKVVAGRFRIATATVTRIRLGHAWAHLRPPLSLAGSDR